MDEQIHNSECPCGKCRKRHALRCDGSGTDRRCATTVPHAHCVCGLTMDVGAGMCDLCKLEEHEPTDDEPFAWDGVTYPSFRRNRTLAPNPQLYELLFQVATGLVTPSQRASR